MHLARHPQRASRLDVSILWQQRQVFFDQQRNLDPGLGYQTSQQSQQSEGLDAQFAPALVLNIQQNTRATTEGHRATTEGPYSRLTLLRSCAKYSLSYALSVPSVPSRMVAFSLVELLPPCPDTRPRPARAVGLSLSRTISSTNRFQSFSLQLERILLKTTTAKSI